MKNERFFNGTILDEIAQKHNTDKSSKVHDYMRFYEFYFSKFRYDNFTILELGVCPHPHVGASLFAWRDYFPHANIVGIDLFPEKKK